MYVITKNKALTALAIALLVACDSQPTGPGTLGQSGSTDLAATEFPIIEEMPVGTPPAGTPSSVPTDATVGNPAGTPSGTPTSAPTGTDASSNPNESGGEDSVASEEPVVVEIIPEPETNEDPVMLGAALAGNEVSVRAIVPESIELRGTAHISLEDTFLNDFDPVELITISVPARGLSETSGVPVIIPVPLDSSVELAVTIFVDLDNSGSLTSGDLISTEFAHFEPNSSPTVSVQLFTL